MRDAVLAAEEDALGVDSLHAVPRVDARLEHGRVVARRDPGVVVEDVDAAEALGGRSHHRLDARLVGDVDLLRECVAAQRGRLAWPRLEVDVGDADRRALLGEEDRRVAAHAAAGAGDHADLAVQATAASQPSVE